MSDIRSGVTGSSLVPQARSAPGRNETVRAAQRAFFQAALNGAATTPEVQPTIRAVAAAQPVRADSSAPTRLLRPGSLVDIKV